MSQILQATKITRNGRISLGQEAMDCIGAKVGDHVKLFGKDGHLWLVKEDAPEIPAEVREAASHA